jgi:hypothetical protein
LSGLSGGYGRHHGTIEGVSNSRDELQITDTDHWAMRMALAACHRCCGMSADW